MSRTYRGIPHKHYFAWGPEDIKRRIAQEKADFRSCRWHERYIRSLERDLLLFGTESRNQTSSARWWYNRAHRVGRRLEREQLRANCIGDDFDFDDSHYVRKYKEVWWNIY